MSNRKEEDAAALVIQAQFRCFLSRRQAAREGEQEQRAARLKAVMLRHHERIQSLEQEKQLIQGLPVEALDALQATRQAAATTIQACWRGARQRQQLMLTVPALAGLRPITCSSPTLPDDPTGGSSQWQLETAHAAGAPAAPAHSCSTTSNTAGANNLIRCLIKHQQLQQEHSAVSQCHSGITSIIPQAGASSSCLPAALQAAGGAGAQFGGLNNLLPCEESSWLSAEASRGLLQQDGHSSTSYCQRRTTAMPAANRALLERQIKVRVDAVSTDASTLRAVRDRQAQTDERLEQLLQEHRSTEARRLQAVRRRQRLLQKADMLHGSLRQLPQSVDQLAEAWPAQYSLPRPGSVRFERAQQAHALSMGEAKSSGWWAPLKKVAQHSSSQEDDANGWAQQEAAWRGSWARMLLAGAAVP